MPDPKTETNNNESNSEVTTKPKIKKPVDKEKEMQNAREQYLKDSISYVESIEVRIKHYNDLLSMGQLFHPLTPDNAKMMKDYQKDYLNICESVIATDNKAVMKRLIAEGKVLKKVLKYYYPKMRKEVADKLDETGWENNIRVKLSGRELTYIGAIFANNKNKLTVKDQLIETDLHNLYRISAVYFKWIPSATGEGWTFTVPKDDEIVEY